MEPRISDVVLDKLIDEMAAESRYDGTYIAQRMTKDRLAALLDLRDLRASLKAERKNDA